MGKKVLGVMLLPALLIIGGYLALQIYLRSGNGKKGSEPFASTEENAAARDSGNQKQPASAAEDGAKTDSLDGKKVSALDLRPQFIKKLQTLVNKTTSGLYRLAVEDMEVDVLTSQVSLRQVTLRPDAGVLQQLRLAGKLPASVFTLSFAALGIEGINLDDALSSKTMDYKMVKLVKPVIRIDRYTGSKQKNNAGFSQQFLKEMEKLAIGHLVVENGQVEVHDKKKESTITFKNVGVWMKNILLNSSTRNDKDRFLFAKEATLAFHHITTTLNKGLYRLSIKDAFVNATGKEVGLKNLRLGSPLSKQAFMKKQSHATELYTLTLPSVTITGADWWPMLNGDAIEAGTVQTKGGRLTVYLDRSLPPKNKMGNFPNQALAKLRVALDVARLQIRDMDIAYEELNPSSGQSGTVSLLNTNITASTLHNNPKRSQPVTVSGTSLLLGTIPLMASFRFPVQQAKKGVFSASLHTGAFNGKVLNPVTRPLGMLNIDEGRVQKFSVTMQGHEWGARGKGSLQYKDLKLSLQEKNKADKGMNDKNLLSFLANALMIRNSNPEQEGREVQQKETSFDRDPNSGFLNLVWKTALTGVLKTIGAPEKMANSKTVEKP